MIKHLHRHGLLSLIEHVFQHLGESILCPLNTFTKREGILDDRDAIVASVFGPMHCSGGFFRNPKQSVLMTVSPHALACPRLGLRIYGMSPVKGHAL